MKSLSSAPHHRTRSADIFGLSPGSLTGVLKVSTTKWLVTHPLQPARATDREAKYAQLAISKTSRIGIAVRPYNITRYTLSSISASTNIEAA
jgi:hypothetical protein